jgi:hypothetical protein
VALATTPGDHRVKQALDIDAVGLHPARPAVIPATPITASPIHAPISFLNTAASPTASAA